MISILILLVAAFPSPYGAGRLLPLQQGAAPGEAGAEAHAQDLLAPLQQPLLRHLVQGDGDAGRRGVSVAHHVLVELLIGDLQLLRHVVDDALVGLVGHEPVDVLQTQAGLLQQGVDTVGHRLYGEAEDLLSVHVDVGPLGAGALDEDGLGIPPGAQGAGVGAVRQGHHRRAGAVAEEDAGAPVGEVGDAAEGLPPDDQGVGAAALEQEAPGHLEGVDEAGAAHVSTPTHQFNAP